MAAQQPYSISNHGGYVTISFSKPPDLMQTRTAAKDLHRRFPDAQRLLWDFTVGATMTPADIRAIAEERRIAAASKTGRKIALVAGSDLYYGLAHIYASYRDQGESEFSTFREMAPAIAWVTSD